jgi:hypothetical protein
MKENKEKAIIALSGFFGGIGPSLAELVSMTKSNSLPEFTFYIGAFVLGIMGMAIAIIARETVPWKAFTQGLGAPALLSSATTIATSTAFLLPTIPTAYASPLNTITMVNIISQAPRNDSVSIIIEGKLYKKVVPGSPVIIQKDDLDLTYTAPDKDSVILEVKVYDPSLRRALIQGLLPMQKNLTKHYERRIILEEK